VIIDVDLTSVPPIISLLEPDDVNAFSVRARGEHAFIDRSTLITLARERANDAAWVERLDKMLAYAASKGWTDENGRTRAHIEYGNPDTR
jgi:hypothetical protein